jgi:signal transduction histidine kinase/PAS domain-containing protein
MDSTVKRTLWGAFALLSALIVISLGLAVAVLQIERKQDHRAAHIEQPLLGAVREMDESTAELLAASRGFTLRPHDTQFLAQYDAAVRTFNRAAATATSAPNDPVSMSQVKGFKAEFEDLRKLTDQQIAYSREDKPLNAMEFMLEAARLRRSAPDYAGTLQTALVSQQAAEVYRISGMRQGVTLMLVVVALLLVAILGTAIWRMQESLGASINRQVRRTEAMIGGMSDGVMLVDGEGQAVFINMAGQELLGGKSLGTPILRHAEVYRLRDEFGQDLDPDELPAAQALATGRSVKDKTLMIVRPDKQIAISMSATPLQEDGQVFGVVVMFRDVTERRQLEATMHRQAEQAQILADAGAFFSSTIDPVWVTQAIAERVAEVLGDWSAVILKSGSSNELQVASIYHRDMASLGLAWSYIYRQPLEVGEGIIGQVVATGYPSLMSNVGSAAMGVSAQANVTSYHAPATQQLASLLILPLRTRRELLGALVIAANDPERRMIDEKLPLAEALAERAALAIENSKLYTEQVEARRKVEDLSRLKDEFLSIASHELRTPVTSIKGYTQLAKTLIRENDLPTSEEYLDIALDQIDRMSRLILELLDVSRIETGRLEIRREPIVWSAFVREVVRRHHTALSDRRFHVNVDEGGKLVSGDRDRLEQVLGNLMENAVKYSPDGSEISVSVEEKGEQLVTAVSDHGIGIPVDELSQVFERFHRGRQVSSANYGGLGLGLYITKQIVERHGGMIWVDSVEGAGTTFHFSLPVRKAETADSAASPAQAAAVMG